MVICNENAYSTKMHIVHVYIQCLLRVDHSLLAGVFLTLSFFCVAPESSYSSAYWQLGSRTALVQLIAPSQWWLHAKSFSLKGVVEETGSCSAAAHFMWNYYWVHQELSADFIPTELTYM